MLTNSVETLLMLDPSTFADPADFEDIEKLSAELREFARQVILFANGLTIRVNDAANSQPSNHALVSGTTGAVDGKSPPSTLSRRTQRNKNKTTKSAPKPEKKQEEIAGKEDEDATLFDVQKVVGCFIAKMFDSKLFRGQVRSVYEKDGEYFFFVEYTDGDKEDLTTTELCDCLTAFAHNQKQGEFSDLSRSQKMTKAELSRAKKDSKRMALLLEKVVLPQEVESPNKETKAIDSVNMEAEGIEGSEENPEVKDTTGDTLVVHANVNSDPNHETVETEGATADATSTADDGPTAVALNEPKNTDPTATIPEAAGFKACPETAEKESQRSTFRNTADQPDDAPTGMFATNQQSTAPMEVATSVTSKPSPKRNTGAALDSTDEKCIAKASDDEPSNIDVTNPSAIAAYALKVPTDEDDSGSPSKRPRLS